MNTKLFQSLENLSVQVHESDKIHLIPPVAVFKSANELLEMINWLGEEAVRDKSITDAQIDAERALNKKPFLRKNLAIRIGSRTLSYVNQTYLLNGILSKAFEKTIKFLKEKGLEEFINDETIDEEVKRMKQEFEPIEIFRHKIAAHTSFSSPWDDSELMQINSLINLTPRPGSVVLGGRSFARRTNGGIPLITIMSYEKDTEMYFSGWVKLFEIILKPLQKKYTGAKGHIYLDK